MKGLHGMGDTAEEMRLKDDLIPTDAFEKWHPDKAAAFPAQAVDVIHHLQAEVERWKTNSNQNETTARSYRAEVERLKNLPAIREIVGVETDLRAENVEIRKVNDMVAKINDDLISQNASLRAEVERLNGLWNNEIEDAIAAKREACAKICDETASLETEGTIGWQTCTELAAAIRARKP